MAHSGFLLCPLTRGYKHVRAASAPGVPQFAATHGHLTANVVYDRVARVSITERGCAMSRLYVSMSTPRMLSDRAEWDAGCSVIVAAQIGDGVARRAPEAQERVAPEQYHLDCLRLDMDAGLQSTPEMSWLISFHAHEAHCGLLVRW